MPAPAKRVTILGLLAKPEVTYGTPITLAGASDGILLQYTDRNVGAPATIEYAYDGSLGPSVGSGAQMRRVSPSGRAFKADLPFRMKGAGVAYSASVTPPHHSLLKAAGFDAVGTFTAGTEKWVYTPTPEGSAYTSLSCEMYGRGEKWAASGVIGDLSMDFSDQQPPVWTFGARGIASLPVDASVPAITYPALSLLPPLASGVTVTIGSFLTATVLSGSFAFGRGVDNARVPISGAASHLGFVPSGRNPIFKTTIEATAFVGTPFHTSSGLDPYSLREAATAIAFALQFGSVQYNKFKLETTAAQLIDVVPNNNGPVAGVELSWLLSASTAVANDDLTITFD